MSYLDNNGLVKLLNVIKSSPQNIKPASTSQIGGVMVGSGLSIDPSGVLSIDSENLHPLPQYDFNRGRYTNESITAWIDSYGDGLDYGMKWGYSSDGVGSEIIKLGANEGLTLEFSTTTTQGKNDYRFRKLFMCPRVHGGVDPDGMPYVTSIEGLDNRFDPENNNTFVLTPIYYYQPTYEGDYEVRWYSDTPKVNYYPCEGAYTYLNELRPYILRACYPVTFGNKWSSVKGRRVDNKVFTINQAYEQSKINYQNLSQLGYQDICYMVEFMMLMLGTKALDSLHLGDIYGGSGYWSIKELSNSNYVITDDMDELNVGMRVDIGTTYTTDKNYGDENVRDIAEDLLITRIENISKYRRKVYFDEHKGPIDVSTTSYINCPIPKTGCLDSVLGTYGSALNIRDDIYGIYPYKFQNMEWGYSFDYPIVNMNWNVVNKNGSYYYCYDIANSALDDIYAPSTGFKKGRNSLSTSTTNARGFLDIFFSAYFMPYPEESSLVSVIAKDLVGAFRVSNECSITTWDIHGPASFKYGYCDPFDETINLGGRISTVGRSGNSALITSLG